MLHVYEVVMATGLPNYTGACFQLPSIICFSEWEALAHSAEDTITVDCLKFGFPVGYKGPIPTAAVRNHSWALHHPCDVAAYITKQVNEGVMLRPYEAPLFTPWCRVNVLLTKPKKDSHL